MNRHLPCLLVAAFVLQSVGVYGNINELTQEEQNFLEHNSFSARSFGGRSFGSGTGDKCQDNPAWINYCHAYHALCSDAIYGQLISTNCKRSCFQCDDQVMEPEYCSQAAFDPSICIDPVKRANCPTQCAECLDQFPAWCNPDICNGGFGSYCQKTCNLCPAGTCSKPCGIGISHTTKPDPNDATKTIKEFTECNPETCPIKFGGCGFGNQPRKWDADSGCCATASAKECGVPSGGGFGPRIIGGKNSIKKEFPWQVAIAHSRVFKCGGAILSNSYVLTAAHCVDNFVVARASVIAGIVNVTQAVIDVAAWNVDKWFIHPDWDGVADNDIALIKVKPVLTYDDNIWNICLPGTEVPEDDMSCIITGFGSSSLNNLRQYTPVLQKAQIEVFNMDVCKYGYASIYPQNIIDMMIEKGVCAGRLNGEVDSCFGDSGGPLVCQKSNSCGWYLLGVSWFGPPNDCAVKKAPGVYSKIAYFQSWITNTMSSNP